MKLIENVVLDLRKDFNYKLSVKQDDVGSRFLDMTIKDEGQVVNLTNHTAKLYALKPDGTVIFNDAVIIDAVTGIVEIELTSQTLAISGTLKCELVIYGTDASVVSSKIFSINITASLRNDSAIESQNEFGALADGMASLAEYENYKAKINENTTKIGTSTLETTAQDLSEAVNELVHSDNTIQAQLDKNMKLTSNLVNVSKFGLDTQAIKDAVSYAKTNGYGGIWLKEGTWTITEPIKLPNNFKVVGNGDNTIITILSNYTGSQVFTNDDYVNGNKNIILENMYLYFDDGKAVVSTGNIHPRGYISFYKVDGVIIKNVNIYRVHTTHINDSQPIWCYDCSNIDINKCYIYHRDPIISGGGSGIWLMAGVGTDVEAFLKNIKIHNCNLDCGGDEPIAIFVKKGQFKNVKIYNNTIYSRNVQAISLNTYGTTTDSLATAGGYYCHEDVEIYGNTFLMGNISLFNKVKNISIHDNTFYHIEKDSGFTGSIVKISYVYDTTITYDMKNISIKNNEFIGNSSYTLRAMDIEKMDNVSIEGNRIYNFAEGIRTHSLTNTTIKDNIILNATIFGIRYSSSYIEVSDNIFLNCAIGIYILESGLNGARIIKNKFKDCIQGVYVLTTITASISSHFKNNDFYRNTGGNIILDPACVGISGKVLLKDNVNEYSGVAGVLNLLTDNTSGEVLRPYFIFYNNQKYSYTGYTWSDMTT